MKLFGWLRRPRLVPIVVLEHRATVEAAWERLQEAGIPASVDGDPGLLGNAAVTRLMVEAPNAEVAQRLIADIVRGRGAAEGGANG